MHTYIYVYIRCILFTLFRHLFLYVLAYRRTLNAFSILSLFLTFLPFFSSPHHNANNVQLQRSYYGFKVIHENSYSPLHTYSDTHTQTHTPCELVTHTITYIAMLLLTELLWRSRTIPQNATLCVELPRAYAISSRHLSTTVSYETFGICVPSPSNKCIRAHNRERKKKNRIPQGLCAFLGWDKSGWKEKNQ